MQPVAMATPLPFLLSRGARHSFSFSQYKTRLTYSTLSRSLSRTSNLRLADEVQALDRLAPPIGVRWVRHFPDVVQQGLPFARTAALLNQLDGGQTVNLSRNCQVRATIRSCAVFLRLLKRNFFTSRK